MERAVILKTDRLAVTTWRPDDLDDLNRLHADPDTMTFIGGRPETRDESSARLVRYLAEQATRGWTKWRLEGAHGQMIGRAGFGDHAGDRELGYTLDRRFWGQGLATERSTISLPRDSCNSRNTAANGSPAAGCREVNVKCCPAGQRSRTQMWRVRR